MVPGFHRPPVSSSPSGFWRTVEAFIHSLLSYRHTAWAVSAILPHLRVVLQRPASRWALSCGAGMYLPGCHVRNALVHPDISAHLPAMEWSQRIENYGRATGFPRSLFVAEDGRVVGTWIMGNDYRVKSGYYGGYPAGYLKRVAALFPDRHRVLHVFSGKVDLGAMPGDTVDSNAAMEPTWVADAHDLSRVPLADYDLVLADPPYSVEDAERYQTTMVKRNVVMRSLAAGMVSGARVVWLDQVLPMYRKDEWCMEATIGMWKSTNHRFRGITIFRRL